MARRRQRYTTCPFVAKPGFSNTKSNIAQEKVWYRMFTSTLEWHDLCPVNSVENIGFGWFAATENSDYIQAIGLSSAKFQQIPRILLQ